MSSLLNKMYYVLNRNFLCMKIYICRNNSFSFVGMKEDQFYKHFEFK